MVFDAHDRAFAPFKGTCSRGIYDNMKSPRWKPPVQKHLVTASIPPMSFSISWLVNASPLHRPTS